MLTWNRPILSFAFQVSISSAKKLLHRHISLVSNENEGLTLSIAGKRIAAMEEPPSVNQFIFYNSKDKSNFTDVHILHSIKAM